MPISPKDVERPLCRQKLFTRKLPLCTTDPNAPLVIDSMEAKNYRRRSTEKFGIEDANTGRLEFMDHEP